MRTSLDIDSSPLRQSGLISYWCKSAKLKQASNLNPNEQHKYAKSSRGSTDYIHT